MKVVLKRHVMKYCNKVVLPRDVSSDSTLKHSTQFMNDILLYPKQLIQFGYQKK
jgi:hypothetical protein